MNILPAIEHKTKTDLTDRVYGQADLSLHWKDRSFYWVIMGESFQDHS